MKSRLIAYGRIQKGRPERCFLVVLDERFCGARGQAEGLFQRWRKSFRFVFSPARPE
ncbi:MAG TPA: hypothetical protein VM123_09140 [archaeon]|nr:hypothetical protein [archaeon]